jgi:hypothetical protein
VLNRDTFPIPSSQKSTEQREMHGLLEFDAIANDQQLWSVNCSNSRKALCGLNMKTILLLLASFAIWLPAGFGQLPVAAGRAANVDVNLGYAYVNGSEPSANRASLNGFDSGITTVFLPHFGLQADIGYVRTANINGSTHHADLLTFLAGPVFYATRRRSGPFYVHALLGGARATGATPTSTGYITGYAVKTAWATGIGTQHKLSRSFGVRVGLDLIHTSFFNGTRRLQGQANFRATIGLVYSFGDERR